MMPVHAADECLLHHSAVKLLQAPLSWIDSEKCRVLGYYGRLEYLQQPVDRYVLYGQGPGSLPSLPYSISEHLVLQCVRFVHLRLLV